ncbi:MAG: hypothetical protein KDD90_01620 [Sphingomonadaceae bacterium]|nr:hypothetical protein [Sphingomonadaceae bacterium]
MSATLLVGVLTAATTQPVEMVREYRADLEFVETDDGGVTRSMTRFAFPLDGGVIESPENLPGTVPMLTGTVTVDGAANMVASHMRLCRPDRSACEELARPELTFALGKSGTFYFAGPDFSVRLTLSPVED